MTGPVLRGDLRERPDGGFDGWCWAPDRPAERLVVELLVNGAVAVSMVAALPRPDLIAFGYGDGRHGFALRLPPESVPADQEVLITARERRSGLVFGRVLRQGPARRPPATARLPEAAAALAAISEAAAPRPSHAAELRATFGRMAELLGARAAQPRAPLASPETPLLRHGLSRVAAPRLTLLLPGGPASALLRRIAALAPALAEAEAELMLVDAGEHPTAALLPAAVPQLAYLRLAHARDPAATLRHAAGPARGATLILLDAAPPEPSAAALLALARAVTASPGDLLLSGAVAAQAARLAPPAPKTAITLPAPLGVLIGGPRGIWPELGGDPGQPYDTPMPACADAALRARLLGLPWRAVREPEPPGLAAFGLAPASAADAARLLARWDGA